MSRSVHVRGMLRSLCGAAIVSSLFLPSVAIAQKAAEPTQAKVFATSKTSTLEKELVEAGEKGYSVVGMTVSKTAIGGKEIVAIVERPAA